MARNIAHKLLILAFGSAVIFADSAAYAQIRNFIGGRGSNLIDSFRRGQQDQICAMRPDLCQQIQRPTIPVAKVMYWGKDEYYILDSGFGVENHSRIIVTKNCDITGSRMLAAFYDPNTLVFLNAVGNGRHTACYLLGVK